MIKYIQSEKGSSLLIVLVSIFIFTMLSFAIITLASANLKMKILHDQKKASLYLGESCFDQSYALILNEIQNVIEVSNKYVDVEIDKFLSQKKKTKPNEYVDEKGKINKRALKKKIDELFRYKYALCINKGSKMDNIKSFRETICSYDYKISNENELGIKILDEHVKEYDISNLNENSVYVLALESQAKKNKVKTSLRLKFEIKIPIHNTSYYIGERVSELKCNLLLSKALMSDGIIDINETQTQINGDVYALGDAYSGCGMNINSSKVFVDGNVFTGEDININADTDFVVSGSSELDKSIWCRNINRPLDFEDEVDITDDTFLFDEYSLSKYNYFINKKADPQANEHDLTDENVMLIDKIVDFNKINSDLYDGFSKRCINEILNGAKKSGEIYLVIPDESAKLAIRGNGSKQGNAEYTLDLESADEIRGIIISNSDIEISGNVNFTGAIITTKNITIKDEYKKVFNNLQGKNFTKSNFMIEHIYSDLNAPGIQFGDVIMENIKGDKSIKIIQSSVGVDNIPVDYEYLHSLVKIKDWEKVR